MNIIFKLLVFLEPVETNGNTEFTFHKRNRFYSRDMGQMVYNYKRVMRGLGCMTIKRLG